MPLLVTLPLIVNVRLLKTKVDPELTLSDAQEVLEPMVTLPVPVVAMMTLSVVAGAVPPTQVLPVAQVPPVAVLVRVAAWMGVDIPMTMNRMVIIHKTLCWNTETTLQQEFFIAFSIGDLKTFNTLIKRVIILCFV